MNCHSFDYACAALMFSLALALFAATLTFMFGCGRKP